MNLIENGSKSKMLVIEIESSKKVTKICFTYHPDFWINDWFHYINQKIPGINLEIRGLTTFKEEVKIKPELTLEENLKRILEENLNTEEWTINKICYWSQKFDPITNLPIIH